MGKAFFLTFVLLAACITLKAQSGQPLKKVMELKMPKGIDEKKQGTRGASVAWHPIQRKYYASFAGNVDYPMAVFDEKAMRLSPVELTAMVDTRGLWYNPDTKQICGNAYDQFGWFAYTLDSKGTPSDIKII